MAMNDNTYSFSYAETGYNHIKTNKVCEDAADFYEEEGIRICAVADGHGSDNYPRTDRGSKYAVQSAINSIAKFVKEAEPDQVINDEQNHYSLLLQLSKNILKEWYQLVEEDIRSHPFEEAELEKVSEKYKERYLSENTDNQLEKAYGATLIAYTVTDKYSFGLQIGDGQCIVVDCNGIFSKPIPWDDNCQMNVTTSICDRNAIEEFRFFITEESLLAVFCGTDGIDDSYTGDEELFAFYRSILKIIIEYGKEIGIKEVKDYLPKLTKKGSGDDVSIAAIIDEELLIKNKDVIELQMQLYKQTCELEERKYTLDNIRDKTDALRKHIVSLAEPGIKPGVNKKKLSETANEIEKLEEEQINLENQITELNENIALVSKRLQSKLFDRDVASFTDNNTVNGEIEADQPTTKDDNDSIE